MKMRKYLFLLLLAFCMTAVAQKNVYRFRVKNEYGKTVKLKEFKGKVLLVVNTATRCGFTPQYKELEELYQKYAPQGLVVLDFPCNQFGQQAPGSIEEIHQFCSANFATTFPLMEKVEVNGAKASPLFAYLKEKQPFKGFGKGETASFMDGMLRKQDALYDQNADIKWNFTKFLIDRDGRVVGRFEPTQGMNEVEQAVSELLKER